MTPTPQEYSSTREDLVPTQPMDGNSVVISGMAGLYPRSHNVKELEDILYNKANPVTHDDLRFEYKHPEVTQHTGSIPELGYFDAQFFKVHYRLAIVMDPMSRKILEQAYQAIYDAGVNPEHLSGKKVGVYIGSCFSESEKSYLYDHQMRTGLGIAGCSKTMFANRISYWLNAKGPSMSIDEACCSSTAALEQAYLALRRGECEAAIVGGSYLCLHPQSSVHYGRIIKMCPDGKTKSFDEHADGCAKSEAINVLFLQKAKDALRIYAEILHVKTEFNSVPTGKTGPLYGFCRNPTSTANFIKKFYEDARVPPEALEYVEAFGSALPEADKIELEVLDKTLCKNRRSPLFIGSVMSNIGYGEAASGITAITKVLLGYHNGKLAANLHYQNPRQDIEAMREGRMQVITDHQQFNRKYVAVNGMSVTGVNSHMLLNGLYRPKDLNRYKSSIPHLVTISGRHEQAVQNALDILKTNPVDPEQLALLHNIHRTSIAGHLGRGFVVLQANQNQETVTLSEKVDYFDDARKPLWFVYSGMGSQWSGMGAQLMRIPIFAAAIQRCDKVLSTKGLDIKNILKSPDDSTFDNILHSFVGIAAVQIGLTDILHALGLKPDGIIGHSVGELGCAYADGCLTAEEMILSAYYRGLVSLETEFIRGSMAAVGLGYQEISKICPPEIEVACHNGPESSTISGPANVMREFVADLSAKGIFAREVPCSNIAYHSRYISSAGPGLLKYLKEAIDTPKVRSERWLSSSVPEDKWEEPIAKMCSAEYLTNNLLSPVLFEETSRLIPSNAVLVEIAPHGLLQAILSRSMPSTSTNIPLTRRKHADNTVFLLDAIGKLYVKGYNIDLRVLYPKVQMPVSTGTPFLSHLVKWAHDEIWPLTLYHSANRRVAANCDFIIALQDKENAYLGGHSVRGNTVFPFAAALTLVWDTLAMTLGIRKKELSVRFEDVQLYSQPILHDRRQLKLSVAIHRGTGRFEVLDDRSKVITGFIQPSQIPLTPQLQTNSKKMYFTTEDIYQLLRDRDYLYSGEFQSLKAADESLTNADLVWQDNWVTFIDGMLQLNVLRQPHHAVSLPTRIRTIQINALRHYREAINSVESNNVVVMNAEVDEELDCTRCGGVIMSNIQFENVPLVNERKLELNTLTFISNHQPDLDIISSIEVYLQIVAENLNKDVITVVGVTSEIKEGSVFNIINNVVNDIAGVKINYKQITREKALRNYNFSSADLVLVQNLSNDINMQQKLQQVLKTDQFVVNEESLEDVNAPKPSVFYRVLCVHSITSDSNRNLSKLELVCWGAAKPDALTTTITVRNEMDFRYLSSVRANLAPGHRLLVVTTYPLQSGLRELISSWRKEDIQNKIYLITINNVCIDKLEEKLSQVELAFNVMDHEKWGGEYYLPLRQSATVSKNVTLQSVQIGDNDSVNWVDVPELNGTGVTVTVHYAGINNNDIKKANNASSFKENVESGFGSDFSGITEKGVRVMGIVRSSAASSRVCVNTEMIWPVPEHWSLEDAATVPLAYAQAFYCLGIKTKLFQGMTVLVHGGAGALGQAVISIALAHDCEVFTTVSDKRKKEFLLKLFPALKADHIGNSRDHTFADMVRSATHEKGCDIIISCLQGYLKDFTLKCTGHLGTCFDVSQLQNHDSFDFGMRHLFVLKNYATVDFSAMLAAEKMDDIKAIHKMMSEGICRGYVRPLSRVTFEPHEAAGAFRLLSLSQHRGRVLLRMKDNMLDAQHRLRCSANCCHLLICNKTSFELRFADRLVDRGVKKLCLHVPSQSSYLQHKIRSWRKVGVDVTVLIGDLNKQNITTILKDASQLAPLEGVYVTVGTEDDSINEKNICDLDFELRKLYPVLKYFAVLNIGGNSIGKAVCLQRIIDQLSATMLTLPALNYESYTGCMRSAVNVTEQALQSASGVFLAYTDRTPRPSMLQEFATLTGTNIPDDVDKSLTLQELGVQNHKLQLIRNCLQIQYNLAFDEEQVAMLTVDAILRLEQTILKHPYEDVKGLKTFFNYVDSDELLATSEIVAMPTHVNNSSMRDDEFVPDHDYLCIIPGMEGHHERFRLLCERLKLPALVLQPGLDYPHETPREMAERFRKVLLEKTKLKDTFYLLGYETGVPVALELAAILENYGLTGTVFCLGCGPDELKNELEEQLEGFESEEQLQDGILRHMYTLMAGADTTQLDKALQGVENWRRKVDMYVRVLLEHASHSAQYARTLIEYVLARLQQARRSSVTVRALRSQIVFLRPAHDPQRATTLQQYSSRPLIVHELSSPFASVTSDLNCAAVINEHLDPAILENFATRNICETYLLHGNTFMKPQLVQ